MLDTVYFKSVLFQAWEMLVLSKLRWSLPPVTAADYLGALIPFFPMDRGK